MSNTTLGIYYTHHASRSSTSMFQKCIIFAPIIYIDLVSSRSYRPAHQDAFVLFVCSGHLSRAFNKLTQFIYEEGNFLKYLKCN